MVCSSLLLFVPFRPNNFSPTMLLLESGNGRAVFFETSIDSIRNMPTRVYPVAVPPHLFNQWPRIAK